MTFSGSANDIFPRARDRAMPSSPPHKAFKIKRRRGACNSCKERKIRCNGERPCNTCHRGDLVCIYPISAYRKQSTLQNRALSLSGGRADSSIDPSLHPLTTTLSDSIITNPVTDHDSRLRYHGRDTGSIDSGIADCNFPFDYQTCSSLPQASVSEDVPQIMSLEQTYKALQEPSRTGFVPINSLLRHLQERFSRENSIPAHISKCLEKLVIKIEALRSHLHAEPEVKDISIHAFDTRKLRLGVHKFFEKCRLGKSFLAKWNIERILERLTKDTSSEDLILLYGVVSLGFQSFGDDGDARNYAKLAFSLAREVQCGQPSVMKLQSITILLLCHLHQPTSDLLHLISGAIAMLQTLGLNTLSVVRNTYSSEYPEDTLMSLVWLLWSVEKILCLEEGHDAVFQIATIEFPPPINKHLANEIAEKLPSSLGIADFCEYAHICWNITTNIQNKNLGIFSHPSVIQSTGDVFSKSIISALDNWRAEATQSLTRERQEQICALGGRPTENIIHMQIFSQYHTALLATFENIRPSQKGSLEDSSRNHGRALTPSSLEAARGVLSHLNSPKNGILIFENYALVNLYLICWCIVFKGMMTGAGQPEDVTLLTIASGLFAQFALSTKLDSGFKEIADLGSAATSTFRNNEKTHNIGVGNRDDSISSDGHFIRRLSGAGSDNGPQMTLQETGNPEAHSSNGTKIPELPDICLSPSWIAHSSHEFDDQFWSSVLGNEIQA